MPPRFVLLEADLTVAIVTEALQLLGKNDARLLLVRRRRQLLGALGDVGKAEGERVIAEDYHCERYRHQRWSKRLLGVDTGQFHRGGRS